MKVKHAQQAPTVKPAAQAPKAAAPPSAKPGEKGPAQAEKAPKIAKVPYGQRDAEGELVVKITKVPADFNAKTNEPLKRKDFATPADFLDYRADLAQVNVDRLRKDAADERSGVGKITKGKEKKLISLKEKYDALIAELTAAGVDVAAALSTKAPAAPAAPVQA